MKSKDNRLVHVLLFRFRFRQYYDFAWNIITNIQTDFQFHIGNLMVRYDLIRKYPNIDPSSGLCFLAQIWF